MTFCLIQDKYKGIYLGLNQAKNQLGYTVCTLYTCTALYKQTAGNQFSCIVHTHSTAALLPLWKQLLLPGWPEPADLEEDS